MERKTSVSPPGRPGSRLTRKASFKPDAELARRQSSVGREESGVGSRGGVSRTNSLVRTAGRASIACSRGSMISRREEISHKEMELEKQRIRKREEGELREACGELRKVAEQMATAKPFGLGQHTLSDWAKQVSDQIRAIEDSIAKIVPIPAAPDNTIQRVGAGGAAGGLLRGETGCGRPAGGIVGVTSPGSSVSLKATSGMTESEARISVNSSVTSGVYLVAEAITDAVRAERCIVYQHVPRMDELQGICIVNGSDLIPSNVRAPSNAGWPGQAFTTGIMANVSNAYSDASKHDAQLDKRMGYRVRSTLCVPIPGKDGGKPFGVVQVMNKNRGTASFSAEDEATLAGATPILSYLLNTYPADTTHHHYDPSALHRIVPFKPHQPQNLALPLLPTSRWLVYRSNQSGHMRKKIVIKENESAVTGVRQNVLEVDGHIRSLEESWMKSVTLNIEFEREKAATGARMKELRDCIKQKKRVIRDLQSSLAACEAAGGGSTIGSARRGYTLGDAIQPSPPPTAPPHRTARQGDAPGGPGGDGKKPSPAPEVIEVPSPERIKQLLEEIKDL